MVSLWKNKNSDSSKSIQLKLIWFVKAKEKRKRTEVEEELCGPSVRAGHRECDRAAFVRLRDWVVLDPLLLPLGVCRWVCVDLSSADDRQSASRLVLHRGIVENRGSYMHGRPLGLWFQLRWIHTVRVVCGQQGSSYRSSCLCIAWGAWLAAGGRAGGGGGRTPNCAIQMSYIPSSTRKKRVSS